MNESVDQSAMLAFATVKTRGGSETLSADTIISVLTELDCQYLLCPDMYTMMAVTTAVV